MGEETWHNPNVIRGSPCCLLPTRGLKMSLTSEVQGALARRSGRRIRKRVLAAVFVVAAETITTAAPPITELERQRLIAHMQMTASWLEDEVSGLSPAQAAFRPSATSWTILEVLDHLVVVGPIYWNDLQSAKPVAGRAGMMNDIDVLWYGIDRTFRETAQDRGAVAHAAGSAERGDSVSHAAREAAGVRADHDGRSS